ncbi:MAG: LemA family protein [Victivallaceae bacterium]|nr:LemA family protein [Victivallaceae bacterium]
MKNFMIFGLVVAAIIIGVALFYFSVRNGLIGRHEQVAVDWSQIDTQLQRRADLIPNLVATVKGYSSHEKEIFTSVAAARSKLIAANGPAAKAAAGAELDGAIGRLLAIAENYPQLKASDNFIRLQDELAGTENRISVARTRYNNSVRDFNMAIKQFPGSLFVVGLGYSSAEYFQPPAGRTSVALPPEVKF